MKRSLLLAAAVVVGLLGLCRAEGDTSASASVSSEEVGQKPELCEDYESSVKNITLADVAGGYYAKYYSGDDDIYAFMTSGELDSSRLDIMKDENQTDFYLSYTMVRKNGEIASNISDLTRFDNTSHTITDTVSGKKEKFLIMSFEPQKHVMIYYCFDYHNETSMLRMLLTKNLTYDLTPALEMDRKNNFTHPLVELPFKNIALLDPLD